MPVSRPSLLLSRLLRLGATQLRLRVRLHRPLGVPDGARTGNGNLAEVSTVVVLRRQAGDSLEGPGIAVRTQFDAPKPFDPLSFPSFVSLKDVGGPTFLSTCGCRI